MSVKGLLEEFKEFAFKGNMIDLAVAVVIGGAFGKIITAIVNDIIMPLIALVTSVLHIPSNYQNWEFHGFLIGNLMAEIINFILIAAAVFIVIVKLLGGVMKAAQRKKAEAPAAPTTRECPLCLSIVPIKASKCAHCTSDLPAVA